MTEATAGRPPAAPGGLATPQYSPGYRGLVLSLLLMVYTVNFIDRTIIGTIGQAIKEDLKLSDTDLGLLQGFAFAILYTTLGIPIARLSERYNRVTIMAVCLAIWSGFTALCGSAQSFAQLLLYRVGVGVGEAGCSPPAHSLIADYYPPKSRATALSIYSFGIPLGAMLGAVFGGWIAQTFSWRLAFVVVGLPGILIALVFRLLVKEPPRGWSDRVLAEQPPIPQLEPDVTPEPARKGHWLANEFAELWAVAKQLFGKWSFLNFTIGVTLASFAGYGAGAFAVPYFIRAFGLNYAEVGLIFGLVGGASTGLGTLLGGFLTDWAGKRDVRWYAFIPAIGLTVAAPLYVLVYQAPSWEMAAALLIVPGIFHYTYLGPTFGVMHNMVEARRRATATALLFFVLNLIALGGGPVFTGWLIDLLSSNAFLQTGLGTFAAQCPGGIAGPGAAAELQSACRAASVDGTRLGQIITVLIYAWAGLHYALGAIGLKKDLAQARH